MMSNKPHLHPHQEERQASRFTRLFVAILILAVFVLLIALEVTGHVIFRGRLVLSRGPLAAEVAVPLPELTSDDLVNLVSNNTGIALRPVNTAVRYWAAYPSEVDAEIAAADAAQEGAEQACYASAGCWPDSL
jgi:hypothetical protein